MKFLTMLFLKHFSKCFSKLERELQKNSSPFHSLRIIPIWRIMTNEIVKYYLSYVSSNREKKSKMKIMFCIHTPNYKISIITGYIEISLIAIKRKCYFFTRSDWSKLKFHQVYGKFIERNARSLTPLFVDQSVHASEVGRLSETRLAKASTHGMSVVNYTELSAQAELKPR